MEPTPLSLLERLRRASDPSAWDRFVALYAPMLFAWARRLGLSPDEAEDLVQDAMLVLLREMPRFVHDGKHSFRAWLKTVLRHCWLQRRPRQPTAPLDAGAEPASPDTTEDFVERDYLHAVSRRALQLMRCDFEPATWQACWLTVVEELPAAEVGRRLGLSVSAVYVARSRVLARLRQELQGLLE